MKHLLLTPLVVIGFIGISGASVPAHLEQHRSGPAAGLESGYQEGGTIVFRGSLGPGDDRLASGEYNDEHIFRAAAGQHIIVTMRSSDFDSWLGLQSPSEDVEENDDFDEISTNSRIELDITESGTWTVIATSYEKDETGSYEIIVEFGTSSLTSKSGETITSGSLASGDQLLDDGRYVDTYVLDGTSGEQVVIDLRSADFDTYLRLVSPTGVMQHNDDFESDQNRSLLNLTLEESGTYSVVVTSYEAGESGTYDLLITQGVVDASASGSLVETGSLSDSDGVLDTGAHFDTYNFEAVPGQRVTLDLRSDEFDPLLRLNGPGSFQTFNDDWEGDTRRSFIETDLTEGGAYTVTVTSYTAGVTGEYRLSIDLPGAGGTETGQRDIRRLAMGERLSGTLDPGDLTLESSGKNCDVFVFDGRAGQSIGIEMTSSEFDTYLELVFPSEESVTNDDFEGSASVSRIDLVLRESGRYAVVATSYASGVTGSYEVTLDSGTTGPAGAASTGTGRIFGLFVGISDYPGEGYPPDLHFCAEDATTFFDAVQRGAGMPAENGVVLTDTRATVDNVQNALHEFGDRVGPGDMFIFFYSGHGGRIGRPEGWERADPDGIDETIALYDGHIRDNEMAELFDGINARVAMLVLDSCFSGGFTKDVICAPGRVGFFSSEEDVESAVAEKFLAGGFLARFIADAVAERLADEDGNGEITSLELSQYLFERYRTSVKDGSKSDHVVIGEKGLNYQHLVVDRYSISPFEVIFK
ncbi:caspase family protein [Gemmatimonadota bacterium]